MIISEYTLDQIGKYKDYYDKFGGEVFDGVYDYPLGEDFDCQFYEQLSCLDSLIDGDYNDEQGYATYIFSSREMKDYYKMARKLGRIMGMKDNNKYIKNVIDYDFKCLKIVDTSGYCFGSIYTETNKTHQCSWEMEVYDEFYDYENLYFALRAIFINYREQLKKLRKLYHYIVSIFVYLLVMPVMSEIEEVAA